MSIVKTTEMLSQRIVVTAELEVAAATLFLLISAMIAVITKTKTMIVETLPGMFTTRTGRITPVLFTVTTTVVTTTAFTTTTVTTTAVTTSAVTTTANMTTAMEVTTMVVGVEVKGISVAAAVRIKIMVATQ